MAKRSMWDLHDRVEGSLMRHPTWADTRHARELGVHRQTVKNARARLEEGGSLAPVSDIVRSNGWRYPYHPRRADRTILRNPAWPDERIAEQAGVHVKTVQRARVRLARSRESRPPEGD